MKNSNYRKQLNDIKSQVLDKIWKVFNKYQQECELNLEHDNGGIDLDYVRYREYSWEQYNDEIIAMDINGEIYTEWDKELNICDFNTCELVRFYEEIIEIYGEQ